MIGGQEGERRMTGKVFLSHSSLDKPVVREVYRILGPSLAEMDEYTFEGGLPNWETISRAFDRCHAFALFATANALSSGWVTKEIQEARQRLKRDQVRRVLIFCLDGLKPTRLPASLRDFAYFQEIAKPQAIANTIQRHLIELDAIARQDDEAFIGRDGELKYLKEQLLDPNRRVIGMSVSGLALMGRRSIMNQAIRHVYPHLHSISSVIEFETFKSCADIALELHRATNSFISPDKLDEIRGEFVSDDANACGKKLFSLLSDLGRERQCAILSDRGGIINNAGGYTNLIEALLASARDHIDPVVFLLTQRRPVARVRIAHPEMAFLDVDPLGQAQAKQYVVHRARRWQIPISGEELDDIVDLGRGHPMVLDYILEKCKNTPVKAALANVTEIVDVSREKAQSILDQTELSDNAKKLLGVMANYLNMPAEFIPVIFDDYALGAEACVELQDNHLIVHSDGVFTITPPLKDFVSNERIGRNDRFKLSADFQRSIAQKFVDTIGTYGEDGVAPINIIDAASIGAIQTDSIDGNWVRHFILPSHYIYLARQAYDNQSYAKSIEYAKSAIANRWSLTSAAFIQACRWLGLSGARLSDESVVNRAVNLLNETRDSYATGTAQFIRGFSQRLSGRFLDARSTLMSCQPVLGNNFALLRELALVHVLLREFDRALQFGMSALEVAPDNPYALDIVARARIGLARDTAALDYDPDWNDIMSRLRRSGSRDGMGFYELRNAEASLRRKDIATALQWANEAVNKSHDQAAAFVIRARVHLEGRNLKLAREDRDAARKRTATLPDRHRRLDLDLLYLEIDIAIGERRWRDAIRFYEGLGKLQGTERDEVRDRIRRGIRSDRREQPPDIRDF